MQTKWAQIQEILENRLTPGQFRVWISPLVPEWEEGGIQLFAPSDFVADFVRARFVSLIAEAVRAVTGSPCQVRIACRPLLAQHPCHEGHRGHSGAAGPAATGPSPVAPAGPSLVRPAGPGAPVPPATPAGPQPPSGQELRAGSLLPSPRPLPVAQLPLPVQSPEPQRPAHPEQLWRFRFEDFVVGPCNELAHAAARSMCAGPNDVDILFLNSAPGLGKTHLLQAVGKALCDSCNRNAPKVEYLTAEEFASRFYLSLKMQDTDRFKARYRDVDLLLLEDVHFLQGKEKMQAELLATIKSLRDRGGKVVFTSSFALKDLRQMDEQLHSRLSAGLLSCIDRPDEPTRRRILRHKASLHQVLLPGDVEDVLAKYIQTDVRQIESCLQNLILKAKILNSGITLEMAWEVIANYASHSPILDMDAIIAQICRGFGLTKEQLTSPSRKQEYVTARNTAFYLARKHTSLSFTAIGQHFNRRHTTVIKGITNLEREVGAESHTGRQIANTIAMIERNGNIVLPVPQ